MIYVFVSNFFNHHQSAFSEAMYAALADDYTFIETEEMEAERKNMGWCFDEYPVFVKRSYISPDENKECLKLINSADVVIVGSAPEEMIKARIKARKLIFRYTERQLKNGLEPLKYIPRWIKWHLRNPNGAPIYMLCASAYASGDYAKFGLFKNRCYKWGYFPTTKHYDDIHNLINNKKQNSILWTARFIPPKHPEAVITVAERLKKDGYQFNMNLIGNGEMFDEISSLIQSKNLSGYVHLLGVMPPDKVRTFMEKSEIFLFTSDRWEGWGAVMNESMNAACVTVANRAIGSVPFLIENGKNGFSYPDGDIDALYRIVKQLIDNSERRKETAKNAYLSIVNEWNAEMAAKRFLELCDDVSKKEDSEYFSQGPCSKAEIIR